jgi:hypothetical protein
MKKCAGCPLAAALPPFDKLRVTSGGPPLSGGVSLRRDCRASFDRFRGLALPAMTASVGRTSPSEEHGLDELAFLDQLLLVGNQLLDTPVTRPHYLKHDKRDQHEDSRLAEATREKEVEIPPN